MCTCMHALCQATDYRGPYIKPSKCANHTDDTDDELKHHNRRTFMCFEVCVVWDWALAGGVDTQTHNRVCLCVCMCVDQCRPNQTVNTSNDTQHARHRHERVQLYCNTATATTRQRVYTTSAPQRDI